MSDRYPSAWLLGFIVPGPPPRLAHMRVYSERNPTSLKGAWAQILVGHGKNFQEGIDDIKGQVKSSYPWLEPYVDGGRLDEVPVEPMEKIGDSEPGWDGWPLGSPGSE